MFVDQDYKSLLCLRLSSSLACRDNQGHLPLFEDFNVFRPRLLQSSLPQRQSSPLAYRDNHGHLLFFTFPRLSKSVVMRRQSWSFSFLYFSKTIKVCRHAKTIMVIRSSLLFQDYQSLSSCGDNHGHPLFFTFPRLSKFVIMRRQSWSSAFLYFSKTIKVCCHAETIMVICFSLLFQDYQSLLLCGDYQCLPPFLFQRLSESSVETSMYPLLCKASRSFCGYTRCLSYSLF